MKKKLLLLSILFLSGTSLQLFGQSIGPQTINSAGNSVSIDNNTYEWSIGEMVLVNTASSGDLTVTQGVLQPLNVEFLSTGTDIDLSQSQLHIFPNPTESLIYLKPSMQPNTKLSVSMLDSQGKVILQREVFLNEGIEQEAIDLSTFATGMYHIHVIANESGKLYSNTYKVNKIH